jgi:hypothetical protein
VVAQHEARLNLFRRILQVILAAGFGGGNGEPGRRKASGQEQIEASLITHGSLELFNKER